MKKLVLYMLLTGVLPGCSEVGYQFFNDISRVQMKETKELRYNFFYKDRETVSRDTVYLQVQILGGPLKKECRLALRQVAEYDVKYEYDDKGNLVDSVRTEKPDKAVAGIHYVAMDSEEMQGMLLAQPDSVTFSVPVILLRQDESLRTHEMRLRLELTTTEDFQLGERNLLARTIIFTDKLSRPEYWMESNEQYYFGTYSERKHEFMQEVAGEIIDDDWIYGVMMDSGAMSYWKGKFNQALEDYNSNPANIEAGLAPMREVQSDPASALITFPKA